MGHRFVKDQVMDQVSDKSADFLMEFGLYPTNNVNAMNGTPCPVKRMSLFLDPPSVYWRSAHYTLYVMPVHGTTILV